MLRKGKIVAGGTDVVLQADRSIRFLVDITQLGLSYIRKKGYGYVIGATTTMADLEHSPEIHALANRILAKAASTCGSVQNRNMATVGGNLANASSAADTATPFLALDSVVVLVDQRGRRKMPLADLFSGPHKTTLRGALIVAVEIPAPARGNRTGWSFQKLGRTTSDISLVNVAAGLQIDSHGCCKWARIALGAVAPTPVRAPNAEILLLGHKLDSDLIDRACDEITSEVKPITDIRATVEYRREMSRVLARRALRECAVYAGCSL